MTPLVTVVRNKLEALGEAVNDGVQQSSGRATPYQDRLTIHSLLLRINEEIGDIHRLCKEDSDLDGVNAVVQVLSVVCSHIDTILETLYGWGREPSNLANTNVDLKKEQEDERVQVEYMDLSRRDCLKHPLDLCYRASPRSQHKRVRIRPSAKSEGKPSHPN